MNTNDLQSTLKQSLPLYMQHWPCQKRMPALLLSHQKN